MTPDLALGGAALELGMRDGSLCRLRRSAFGSLRTQFEPDGCFAVEVLLPGLRRLPPGGTCRPFDVSPTHLGFDDYDVARQGLVSHHCWIEDGKVDFGAIPLRHVWPSEPGLMARIAGMRLCERFGGWGREPFTADSARHASVWVRACACGVSQRVG